MCKKGPPAVWTKEKIEEAFAGFVEKNRRLPVAREMKPQYGLPTRRTFERYMDMTAQEYAELRYPTLLSARDERHVQTVLEYRNEVREWSIERLMEAEKNFFTKCGRLPEPYEYTAENGLPMYSVFCRLAKEAFEETLSLVQQVRFDALVAAANRISEEKHRAYEGSVQRVLVDGAHEGRPPRAYARGRVPRRAVRGREDHRQQHLGALWRGGMTHGGTDADEAAILRDQAAQPRLPAVFPAGRFL